MRNSEKWHRRPPYAGVSLEFEAIPSVDKFFCTGSRLQVSKFKKLVQSLITAHMEIMGYTTVISCAGVSKNTIQEQVKIKRSKGDFRVESSKWFRVAPRYVQK